MSKRRSLHPRQLAGLVSSRSSHKGQVLVLVALMLVALVGFVALSVDAGYLMSQRRGVQAATDGASQAADKAYQRNEESQIDVTAYQYAADSGFPNGGANEVRIIKDPPGFSEYEKCVKVEIDHDVTEFFIGAIYAGDWQVGASAVACTDNVAQPYALIALEDGDDGGSGIISSGDNTVTIQDGGSMSNAGTTFQGNVIFDSGDGPIDAVDGITVNGNPTVEGEMDPTAGPIVDPYAHVPQLDCSALPDRSEDDDVETNITNNAEPPDGADSWFFPAGYYPDGISIRGEHEVEFGDGLYCFGDEFYAQAGENKPQNLYGTGETLFYFEDPAVLNINGQGVDVDFTGVDTYGGVDYENIVFFYQRDPCHSGDFTLNGNHVSIDGVFYAPCAAIDLAGNNGVTVTGQIVGGEIDLSGTGDMDINFDSDVDAMSPQVYLVE